MKATNEYRAARNMGLDCDDSGCDYGRASGRSEPLSIVPKIGGQDTTVCGRSADRVFRHDSHIPGFTFHGSNFSAGAVPALASNSGNGNPQLWTRRRSGDRRSLRPPQNSVGSDQNPRTPLTRHPLIIACAILGSIAWVILSIYQIVVT